MKLPNDPSGRELAKALRSFGHEITRQSGSHLRLTTSQHGEQHLPIPDHSHLRVGTLAAILAEVAAHHRLEREDLARRLLG